MKIQSLATLLLLFTLLSCVDAKKESDEFVGYDMKGDKQSCPPMKEEFACTMMLAPSDFFGMQCREQGLKAFQCGCHYWLCETPIEFKQEQ